MDAERADHSQNKNKYPVLCAWCEKEGRETVLNWIEIKGSHGICPEHRVELVSQAKATGLIGRIGRMGWI